ncbi:MAG TPA: outer membrane beta-barrel protein [Vicinamibacteria bacterium]|nr:outer membrane beta-barrel protein [Vicinamibacteria bacterium]
MSARRAVLALAALALPRVAVADDSRFAIDAAVGYQDLTSASDSAKAVFDGSSGGLTLGGGARFGLGDHLYVGAFARYFSKDGERVFVSSGGGEVFRLGHPLSLRLVPVHATVGWRFGGGSLRPYAGGGVGFTSYREESTVGGVTESASDTKFSAHVLGGLEFGRGSLRVAAEAMWTTVPDSLGVGGVSEVYGESDIGGLSVVGKVVFALGN